MCMVSNIGDGWKDIYPQKWPQFPSPGGAEWPSTGNTPNWPAGPSQADFDALKKEMEELKKLLKAAKAFDEATGQPHCEMDEKVALIKKIAETVGVDLGDVFGPEKK